MSSNGFPAPPKSPRILWLTFASLRSHDNQDIWARGLARMMAHDLNRGESGCAAAALLTARKRDVKGFVLPAAPAEPGPMGALGEALGARWIVQGFSRILPNEVDLQVQWVDATKSQVSSVQRFQGKREELVGILDRVRQATANAFGVPPAPTMPPAIWSQSRSADALESFLLYLDNSFLLYDPAERPFVGELRDPVDCLKESLKHDRFFRAAGDMLAAENKGEVNPFGAMLEIDVDPAALL